MMPDHGRLHASNAVTGTPMRVMTFLLVMITGAMIGCASTPRNVTAINAYYRYDFTAAREALRGDAMTKNDEQTLLNHARLGLAALADGDLREAEHSLGYVFNLLSTAGLNEDRTTAAVWVNEGVRIWKGEPFEQALMYHAVATLYAVKGDWENTRAAAANSIFRLTDFGEYRTPEALVQQAARNPEFLEEGYTAVDTDFALGLLMQAVAADHAGAPGRDELLDAALRIDPTLDSIASVIRGRAYDTLLIVEYGEGPAKIAYGPDDALVRFEPHQRRGGALRIRADDQTIATFDPVADINRMAQDHRWNNLEDVRRAKSAIGELLVTGGSIAAVVGTQERSAEAALAGFGAAAIGLLLKSGAAADTRYLEFAPRSIYLVPLQLREIGTIDVSITGDERARIVLPDFEPGTPDRPRAVYLRLHGPDSPAPVWLTATELVHGNDVDGVQPGDRPWLLGGFDVSTPSRASLEAYQAGGHLTDLSVRDLTDLYRAEDILLGSGMEDRPDRRRNPSFRHILEGGSGLFTPALDSMGYKRLMYTPHPPYEPRSARVRKMFQP